MTVDAHSKKTPPILLQELAYIAGDQPNNLTSIFDAGWTRFDEADTAKMATNRIWISPSSGKEDKSLKVKSIDRDPTIVPQIGLATIYTGSITKIYSAAPEPVETRIRSGSKKREAEGEGEARGVLTLALVEALQLSDPREMSYAGWISGAADAKPHVLLKRSNARLFESAVTFESAMSLIKSLRDRDLYKITELLERLTELRRARDPNSYLDLAIACKTCGQMDKARSAVEIGLSYRQQKLSEGGGGTSGEMAAEGEVYWPEAHYLRGWILYEIGHYSAAENATNIALRQLTMGTGSTDIRSRLRRNFQIARAHYWHGRAVQELIRQDLLAAAEKDFKEYLRLGAPLGDSAGVEKFLSERETRENSAARNSKRPKHKNK